MKEHPARSPEGRVSPETRIHLDGLQAAALALAGSCLPPPVSLAMDATGLDAVAWTQRRMSLTAPKAPPMIAVMAPLSGG